MFFLRSDEIAVFDQIESGDLTASATVVDDLSYGGFVVPRECDELRTLEERYVAHRFSTSNALLTIAPTMACNFGCDYCFQGQNKPHESMSAEVQAAIVGLIDRASPEVTSLGVSWYGGEPLIRRDIVERLSDEIIAACARKHIAYSAMVVTNGYRLDVDCARSLQARGVNWIQVTLDGPQEHHDRRRHLLGGQGTFERIIANLKAVAEAVPVTLAIRVNIDARNRQSIDELIDYMAAAGLSGRDNLKVYFAPVEAITEGCHGVEEVTLGKTTYGQLEAELYQHGYRAGLTSLPYPPRFSGLCGAIRPTSLVVLPNGDLHKCWDTVSVPDHRVGTIFKLDALATNELFLKWINWTPFQNTSCRNCKILPNCAGACAYKFIHAEGTRGEAAILPCPSWKYNIKERLLQRATETGMLSAEDWDANEVRTNPSELCAEKVVDGGMPLPPAMEALLQKPRRLRLPVIGRNPASRDMGAFARSGRGNEDGPGV